MIKGIYTVYIKSQTHSVLIKVRMPNTHECFPFCFSESEILRREQWVRVFHIAVLSSTVLM